MIKICVFLLCVSFVVQTNGDCADNFLKCFSEFAESFFQNFTDIEHVNASVDNLPEDYKQVKDVEIKTIEEITGAIQNELLKQLETHAATDVIVTDNPKTKIYVKTFSYDFGDSFIHNFENLSFDGDDKRNEEDIEDQSSTRLETVKDSNVKYENKEFAVKDRSKHPTNVSTIIDSSSSAEELNTGTEKEKVTVPVEVTLGDRYSDTKQYKATTKAEKEHATIENSLQTAMLSPKSENNDEFTLEGQSIISVNIISSLINSYIGNVNLKTTSEKDKATTPTNVVISINNGYNAEVNKTNTKRGKEEVTIENHSSLAIQTINNNEQKLKVNAEGSTLIAADKLNINISNKTSNINKPVQKTQADRSSALTTVNQNNIAQIATKQDPKTDISAKKLNDKTESNNSLVQKKSEDWLLAHTVKPDLNTQKLNNKQFELDIRENLIQADKNNYEEDTTDYPQIDYIDLYKDTTNEEKEYVPTDKPKADDMNEEIVENVEEYRLEIETELDNDTSTNICHGNTSDISNIFPWIATIFIKNDTANQFQYICDGALLSDKLLITAARCVNFFNSTVKPDDVLVFLGKRSLVTMGDIEKNVRVSKIIVHGNFSNADGKVYNDLALLGLEESVAFTDGIRPACVGGDRFGKSATTAWDLGGALTPVFYENNDNKNCNELNEGDKTFCATYGNEVALCPSYGGVFATKRANRWYLHAIRSGDTADRGLCYTKDVLYTPLVDFQDWILENME